MRDDFGVPEIFEDEANYGLKLLYDDIKFVLKVPIVNFIFRVLAYYDKFLFIAWKEVRKNMLTANMEKAAQDLRYPEIFAEVPRINWSEYYEEADMERIRRIVFTFNYVNTKLLLIASAWAESLSSRPISGGRSVEGYINPGVYKGLPQIKIIDITDAPHPIRELLLDISKKHRAFDVASDYRALAYYPQFLSISWSFIKPYAGTDEYNIIASNLKEKAVKLAHTMPFPVTVDRKLLEKTYSEKDIAGIMGVVSMFQNFLPPLIIDGELFRRSIDNNSSH